MPWGLTRFHESGQSHFVTFCCYHRDRLFTTDASRRTFVSALERVRRSYRLRVYGYVVSTFGITHSFWRSCAIFIEILRRLGCASARRTGSGAVFVTTQPAVKEGSRSSQNGPRANANEQPGDFVRPSNCPTQAKTGLEWAAHP
jgi:hypothetical protein